MIKLRGLIWQRRMARLEVERRRLSMQIRACLRRVDDVDADEVRELLALLRERTRCELCGSLVRGRTRLGGESESEA